MLGCCIRNISSLSDLGLFSTGSLHELRQFNLDYVHPDRNVAYLISKINLRESNGFWDDYHVKQCSAHMPHWVIEKRCVEVRIAFDFLSTVVGIFLFID